MGLDIPKPYNQVSLTVWIISLHGGESVSKDDFAKCSKAVDKSLVPKHSYLKGEAAWRYIVASLLPQMVMRRKHIPRSKWDFYKTKVMEATGKPYVALKSQPGIAMGFSTADPSPAPVLAFAHAIGPKHQVINLGIGMRPSSPPSGVTADTWVRAHLHELTAREHASLGPASDSVTVLRRLTLLLSIKDAYIRAIGQPVGFDYARIEVGVPEKSVRVDGELLSGWVMRMFSVTLPSHSSSSGKSDGGGTFQMTVACFKGHGGMKFTFEQGEFVSFFEVGEVVRGVERLGEYDHSEGGVGVPAMEDIPFGHGTPKRMGSGSGKGKEREFRPSGKSATMPPLPVYSSGAGSGSKATSYTHHAHAPSHSNTLPPPPIPVQIPSSTHGPPQYSYSNSRRER